MTEMSRLQAVGVQVDGSGRVFDYVPRLVDANLNYLIREAIPRRADWNRSAWWTAGPITDQGSEGACVGHGVVQEYLSSPVRGRLAPHQPRNHAANLLALSVYNRAKEIDEWEGVDYDGTSVRAGLLVGREKGWWNGFYWAKNLDDVLIALQTPEEEGGGPVIIGVEWREGMYKTSPGGLVVPGGPVVGGHCLLITGFSPRYRMSSWSKNGAQPMFRWRNSWGPDYGKNGNGYITPEHLDEVLFQARGEAAVVTQRQLGLAA